jgi:type III pantothenate kinase
MRLGVIDVGNSRTKRALFDGRRIRPLRGPVEAWVGVRVGRGPVPRGTLLLGSDFPPLVKNPARTVGADRLVQASGAWVRAKGACVIISLGTAITIDAVNSRGEFMGGLIAPGLRLMAKALHEHTVLLPEIEPARRRSALGRRTRDAIQSGISLAAEGLIRAALAQHQGRVFGTGGDAPLYRELFDLHVPELGLEGVAHSYLCWRRS